MHPEKPNRAIQSAHGHLVQLACDVLAMAKKDGATEADVVVADGKTCRCKSGSDLSIG